MEGTLPAVERPPVVEHLADCDMCREIVATVAAAVVPDVDLSADEDASAPVAASDDVPSRGSLLQRRGTWVSAAVALAATVLVALQLRGPAPVPAASTIDDPWAAIAGVVGTERHLEARLSQLAAHVPLAAPTRAGSAPAPSFAADALAAQLADAARSAPAARRMAATHAAGVAALVAGRAAEAVTLLRAAANETAAPAANAAVLSDLAAAQAALGATGTTDAWTASLASADAALRIDGTFAPARFNRALALERLGRLDDAVAAWRALADDAAQAPGWRDEAAAHARALAR